MLVDSGNVGGRGEVGGDHGRGLALAGPSLSGHKGCAVRVLVGSVAHEQSDRPALLVTEVGGSASCQARSSVSLSSSCLALFFLLCVSSPSARPFPFCFSPALFVPGHFSLLLCRAFRGCLGCQVCAPSVAHCPPLGVDCVVGGVGS